MAAVVERFIRSKTMPPRLHRGAIERPRLVDRLVESDEPVWLLRAPAGYGKTTLLLQAADAMRARLAWMSVDGADNDPIRFWTHVCAALVSDPEQLEDLLDMLEPDHLQWVIDQLIGLIERSDEPVLVVFDDLHEVAHTDTLDAIARIALHPPRNLTLVFSTRSDLQLPIGRLRSRGALLEVGADALAFTLDEATMLFDGQIDPELVVDIVTRTEGWVTALLMLSVSAGPGRPPDEIVRSLTVGQPDLADFLAAEVLDAQDDDVQRFLVETSLLDELDPALCDELTGRAGSLAIIRELARNHVFTQLVDPELELYKYHPLFRQFLLGKADELDPARVRKLHCMAAQWYLERDEPSAVVRHAVAAGDFELARRAITENTIQYAQRGLFATVADWLDLYGVDRCRYDPTLRLSAAWAALNVRRYDEIEQWLDPPDDAPPDPPDIRAQVTSLQSHLRRHQGDVRGSLAAAVETMELIDESESVIATESHAALGLAMLLSGDLDREPHLAAVRAGLEAQHAHPVMSGYSGLAFIASTDGDSFDEAERLADLALGFVDSPVTERFHQPALALVAKGRVALATGRVGDADGHARRAEQIAAAGIEPLMLVLVFCLQARIAHRLGDMDRVRERLRRANEALGSRGGDYLAGLIRETRNDTRFVEVDPEHLPPGAVELTERELAVLRLLPHRLPRKELANQLFVSENTVKTHLTSIRHKLGASTQAEIVETARRLGLIPDG